MKFYLTDLDPLDKGIYHHELLIERADGRAWSFAWRWLPLIRWRWLSRAWQGYPPPGYTLATDWTGRTRELIGITWPARFRPVSVVLVDEQPEPPATYVLLPTYEPPAYRIGLDGVRKSLPRIGTIESYAKDSAAVFMRNA
jgi:hypothetical protein